VAPSSRAVVEVSAEAGDSAGAVLVEEDSPAEAEASVAAEAPADGDVEDRIQNSGDRIQETEDRRQNTEGPNARLCVFILSSVYCFLSSELELDELLIMTLIEKNNEPVERRRSQDNRSGY